ncbi:MAG: hypothetical protein ACTTIC_06840 [Helicobacteraceae bacterium]
MQTVGIITYDFPHLKTEQVVHILLENGAPPPRHAKNLRPTL